VQSVSTVKQIEIHTTKPLVSDPSPLEIEITIETLKILESPDIDQIIQGAAERTPRFRCGVARGEVGIE
jgi:hypothetical protein